MFTAEIQKVGDAIGLKGRFLADWGFNHIIEKFNRARHATERGKDWMNFAEQVHTHVEDYTVPQYGDKGQDQCTNYDSADCVKQAMKYLSRFRKNTREGQQELDFMKAAHYIQMAADKYKEEKELGI